jgi:hypothetical protein
MPFIIGNEVLQVPCPSFAFQAEKYHRERPSKQNKLYKTVCSGSELFRGRGLNLSLYLAAGPEPTVQKLIKTVSSHMYSGRSVVFGWQRSKDGR